MIDQTRQERDTKTKDYRSPDLVITEQVTEPECLMSAATVKEDCSTQEKAASSPPRGLEKKVRFSDELVKESELSQEFARSESRCPGSIKGSSPKKNKPQIEKNMEDGCILQDEGRGLPPAPVTQLHETECTPTNDSLSPPPARKAQSLDELLEVGKCNMSGTNTGMPYTTVSPVQCIKYSICLIPSNYRGAHRLWSVCPEPGVRRNAPSTLHQQR